MVVEREPNFPIAEHNLLRDVSNYVAVKGGKVIGRCTLGTGHGVTVRTPGHDRWFKKTAVELRYSPVAEG